ncbi:hypothetical protein KX928_17475 [Roseobacter sp. YSTF-M11]|uniref:Uncharacterized protein n=1 Tax=Roseobacter insulae TaxID=2859783 RepID=A0A9X1FWX6_9RHOB|nr:hypothetical protein [Roseobacter insulae]MBW4709580.1 hypothetical protein [Roseobacter insulae]
MPETLSAYPSPYYALALTLSLQTGGPVTTLNAAADATAWRFTVDSAVTSTLTPGVYAWAVLATEGGTGNRTTICRGTLTVDPDPATATGDTRSNNARILDAIEATIEGRATKDADAWTIEGRSITRTPIADLIRLKNIYSALVDAERGRSAPFKVRRVTH